MSDGTFYIDLNKWLSFEKSVKDKIVTTDTINLIIKTINNFYNTPYIAKVVEILSRGNPTTLEFLKRLFGVCCANVKYTRDPVGHEIVFTPQLLMKVGKGDCKKFTTFICAVLKNKGIPCATKVVSYDGKDWEHIYAIVPTGNGSYITLDPVNHCRFNSEVDFKKAQIFYLDGTKSDIMTKLSLMGNLPTSLTPSSYEGYLSMVNGAADDVLTDIEVISGVGENQDEHDPEILAGLESDYIDGIMDDEPSEVAGIGAKKEARKAKKAEKKEVKQQAKQVKKQEKQVKREQKQAAKPAKKIQRQERRQKVFNVAKKGGFAPTRAAFLGLIRLAGALEKTPLKINLASALAKAWQTDNGKDLTAMWEKFGGKRDALKVALSKAAGVQLNGLGNLGAVTAAGAAAVIAASTPILVTTLKYLKSKNIIDEKTAAFSDNAIEVIEDAAQNPDGTFKDMAVNLIKETPLFNEGAQIDQGGNKTTQKQIVQEANEESPTPQAPPQSNNNPENLPAPTDMYKSSKSMLGSIYLPTVWLRMCVMLLLLINAVAINQTLSKLLSMALFTGFIISTINLFINSKKNNNGKI